MCGESNCTAIHDFACDGVGWRLCFGYSVGAMVGLSSDAGACTLENTEAVPDVRPSDVAAFTEGPRVSNSARAACTVEYWAFDEAKARCTAPECFALHDYNCDTYGWRVCSNSTIGDMQRSGGPDTQACTSLPPSAR